MVSTQVRQSEDSGFKSRSGQIAYFHGVKTRLSTLDTAVASWLARRYANRGSNPGMYRFFMV